LKRLGFSLAEIRRMTWRQAVFWLEAITYDTELAAEAMSGEGGKEVRNLDDLVRVLPKTGNRPNGVRHQG